MSKTISPLSLKPVAAAIVGACLLVPIAGHAADAKPMAAETAPRAVPATTTPAEMDRRMYSDRAQLKGWNDEKEQLQKALNQGQNKANYAKIITERGFQITSINEDKPDYIEYEVVKGGNSYEVQIDLDNNIGKKVDVTTNMWRADATKAALRGTKVAGEPRYVPTNVTYSDRARMKTWGGEKERLEKTLATGHEKGWYVSELKKLGYQVTSTNDFEKDYVEYEIVKGDSTYEVQIDFENTKAKEVDVTTNMWQSDATERALAAYKR